MRKLLAISLALLPTVSFAWGDREQGIAAGILGTIIIQEAIKDRPVQRERDVVIIREQTTPNRPYYDRYGCRVVPVRNQYGSVDEFVKVCDR